MWNFSPRQTSMEFSQTEKLAVRSVNHSELVHSRCGGRLDPKQFTFLQGTRRQLGK